MTDARRREIVGIFLYLPFAVTSRRASLFLRPQDFLKSNILLGNAIVMGDVAYVISGSVGREFPSNIIVKADGGI